MVMIFIMDLAFPLILPLDLGHKRVEVRGGELGSETAIRSKPSVTMAPAFPGGWGGDKEDNECGGNESINHRLHFPTDRRRGVVLVARRKCPSSRMRDGREGTEKDRVVWREEKRVSWRLEFRGSQKGSKSINGKLGSTRERILCWWFFCLNFNLLLTVASAMWKIHKNERLWLIGVTEFRQWGCENVHCPYDVCNLDMNITGSEIPSGPDCVLRLLSIVHFSSKRRPKF